MSSYERDPDFWRKHGLKAELEFHKKNKWRPSSAFERDSLKLFEEFGLKQTSLSGQKVLDAGCGSKLRTRVLTGAHLYALDPLAKEFAEEISWSDLNDAEAMYSIPLEEHKTDLDDKFDAVVCINVIDHGFQSSEQLKNMARYLKSKGKLFLAVDLERDKQDKKHNPMSEETVFHHVEKAGLMVSWAKTDTDTFDRQAKRRLLLIAEKF